MAGNIFDQFDAPSPAPAPQASGNVFDQFDAPAQEVPASPGGGWATRAQRDGSETQAREGEYLADAVRTRLQQDKASPMGRLDAYARGVAGWVPGMNKLAAAGNAAFGAGEGESFGERYSDNLMRERALDTADEALMPGSRLTGQASGLMATAALLPNVSIVREGTRGAATANAAATGGAYGAVTGAIESDGGFADKGIAALETGAVGGAFGAAAPSFVRAAEAFARGTGKLASKVATPFRVAANPEAEAGRRVSDALARDGVADPAGRLAEMQRMGAPAVAADVGGETTRALARSAANTSPEGRAALNEAVSERFAGQGDRITDLLRGFGPASAGKTMDELEQAARLANRPAYGRAYMQGGRGLWSDNLESLAQAPALQDAIRSVIKTGANKTVADGMPPVRNPFTTDSAGNLTLTRNADGSIARPNLQFWDYVQRELRGKAGEAGRAGNKDLAGDYTNLRRMLVNELDTAVPSFKEARSGAAQFFQAEDALEAGQKFVTSRMANDEARKALGRMKPAERELFAEGFRSDLIAKIRETGDGRDIVKAIFGSPASRERVEIALGKSQALQLQAALNVETAMLRLQEAVKGNSSTPRQLMEMGLSGGAGGIGGYAFGGDPGSVSAGFIAGALTRSVLRRGNMKINEGLARKVAEMLASGDPKQLQSVAKMAAKNPSGMRLLEALSDEAGKLSGLSAGPLEVTVRPRGVPGYVPAAADDEQQ
jgi:hypothetical protein